MSRTLKPLFRPEVIRDRLGSFPLPPGLKECQRKLATFATLLARRDARRLTEENLKPGFFADVFCELLGYRTPNQSPADFNFVPEFPIPNSQGRADAVLGRAPQDGRNVIAAIEIKGPLDPLDIPFGGRRLSAVEQGFDYAINLGCDWIVVSSMAETRLYYKGADRYTCERFETVRLASDEAQLRRFVFILGAERVVPPIGRSHFYDLLNDSKIAGENITKEFYREYCRFRGDAFTYLCRANPAIEKTRILSATQKLLDRVLFCAFGEDRGLLPPDTIRNAFDHRDPYNPRHSKWDNFRGLFHAINEGSPHLKIPRYNGGLFAPDPVLDFMMIPDEVCAIFKRLADFDYHSMEGRETSPPPESAAPAPGAAPRPNAQIVDVEILGHIFEQSITDLERLRMELEGRAEPPSPKQAKARRKKEGAFYTPKFITRYIVGQTLGPVLRERLEALRARYAAAASRSAKAVLDDPFAADPDSLAPAQRKALIAFWVEWQSELGRIRVLDPACGSGAFLIEAFDQLLAAYQDANARLEALRGHAELFDLNRQILQQNLYGVDLNDEAVEICRLSLWIKTAENGKILADLDPTIRAGNSVVDDPAVHPRAFDWRAAFPEVFADGGFDAVIGNPPYIRQEWLTPYKDHFEKRYKAYSGTADLCLYFIERGLDLLKPCGRLGFITSGTFARGNFAQPFRKWLPTTARFSSLVNFGENQPFEEAEMVYPTISILEKKTIPGAFPTLFISSDIPASISEAIDSEALICDESVFEESEWKFQPKEVTALFRKIMAAGKPLGEVCEGRMYRGVLTGLNEAFIIDTPTRDRLVAKDKDSEKVLRPILKGEDLRPWYQDWEGWWLILLPAGFTRKNAGDCDEKLGWKWLEENLPSIACHLKTYEEDARKRADQGEFWWELRPCDYYAQFDQPKILWPDISKLPRFSWDSQGLVIANTAYALIPDSEWLLSVMQSRLFWFSVGQIAQSLRLRGGLWQFRCIDAPLRQIAVSQPNPDEKIKFENFAREITALAAERQKLHIKARHRISTDLAPVGKNLKPGYENGEGNGNGSGNGNGVGNGLNNALTAWWTLDFKKFRAEIQNAFKADIPIRERDEWEAALKGWRGEHGRLTARVIALEEELNARVYRLFGLTPSEIATLEDFQKRTKTFYPLGEV